MVETVTVTSGSMRPVLEVGDRLVVLKTTSIEPGDVIVFDGNRLLGPSGAAASGAGSPLARLLGADPTSAYVKRVIGAAGDHVVCCADDGRILRNGEPLDEPYAIGPSDAIAFDVTVPADRYWVLGDNRSDSTDSRSALGRPGGGMLRADDVIGEVVWRYWPPAGWGGIAVAGPADTEASIRTDPHPVSGIGNTAQDIDLLHPHKEPAP